MKFPKVTKLVSSRSRQFRSSSHALKDYSTSFFHGYYVPAIRPGLCIGEKQTNQSGECTPVTRGLSRYSAAEDKTIGQVPQLNISVIHQQACLAQWQQSDNDSLWYVYNALSFRKHFPILSHGHGCHNNLVKPERLDYPENQREVTARITSCEAQSQTLGS